MQIPSNPPAPAGLCEIRALDVRDADPDPETGVERWEFHGHAAVFDELSENLGGFREVIKRGAFKDVLGDDVRFLVDHDSRYTLARSSAGNLKLEEKASGLYVTAQVRSDLSYAADLRVNLEEGNVTQMSFAFGRGVEDDWDEDEDGRLIRTIKRFKELFDVSTVTYPAYPQTDAGVRAINRLRSGETVTAEERAAIEALLQDSPEQPSEERQDGADAQEPVAEGADGEERAEVEGDSSGAGGRTVAAAKRRVSLLAMRERL